MPRHKDPVLGYFAFMSPMEVVCTDVDACVIAGSRATLEQHLAQSRPDRLAEATVKKTRFREVLRGLRLGAAYAFDEESYSKFYPMAQKAGLPVQEADFVAAKERGDRFFTVRLVAL